AEVHVVEADDVAELVRHHVRRDTLRAEGNAAAGGHMRGDGTSGQHSAARRKPRHVRRQIERFSAMWRRACGGRTTTVMAIELGRGDVGDGQMDAEVVLAVT